MLLTITTTHPPASDLGYLLHQHPDRCQSFDLSFGKVHVFYPEVSVERCSACLLLDVDPVGMVRGKNASFTLAQYVNDRPYAASSFMSVAIAQVFGSALQGRCKDRPELAQTAIPLSARIDVLPVRGGERFLRGVFEPLGYLVDAIRCPLDERFPEWGESPYFAVTIRKTTTLADLLTHLYVLIPVFDNAKHYWIGEDEMEKLLARGEGWLAGHPEKEEITRRYLKYQPTLFRQALARLVQEEEPLADGDDERPADRTEDALEKPLSLNQKRLGSVVAALRASGAKRVLDLGCGEGKLIRELLKEKQFEEIVGLDVSIRALEVAQRRLKLERLPSKQADRVKLIHGSLMYRDKRLEGFDAAAVIEVIEHLDAPRLSAFERVLFEFARPRAVVLTTPNREYNVKWGTLGAGRLRHPDHRFEWTRSEFQEWAKTIAGRFGYTMRFVPVGTEDKSWGHRRRWRSSEKERVVPMAEWNIGLSAWIIQDGNYADFHRHEKARFAVEFYPHDIRPIAAAARLAECTEGSRYRIHAQVACVLKGAWVIDFGVQAFHQSKPPQGIRRGQWIAADVYVGIDPFFYFESLAYARGMPPLTYSWFIRRIRMQTDPFIATRDTQGTRILRRDESKSAYRDIAQTHAWSDDGGHGEYVLECELLDARPSRDLE